MLSSPVRFEQKIQRSTFAGFLYPVRDAAEAKHLIGEHQKTYANATHNCYAYVCGYGQEIQYYSDAGEPHNTAGKPILNALLRHGLTFTLAIVTRYFGGVKLGTKGLAEAYGDTAEQAIGRAELRDAVLYTELGIVTDYAFAERLAALVLEAGGSVADTEWAERVRMRVRVPEASLASFTAVLDGLKAQFHLDYHLEKEP
jgi:uncharacterized YigZ family protein